MLFSLVVLLLSSNLVLAGWYKGSLHQHTGFSTETGYDGVEGGGGDDCSEWLEGIPLFHTEQGKNVPYLTQSAVNQGLSWLSFTDHTYCLDSSEFNTVKNDCDTENTNRAGSFACLTGVELSVSEEVRDSEPVMEGSLTCYDNNYGEGHLGANGISSYISQKPSAVHCPKSPKAQAGINDVNAKSGISIINHPDSGIGFINFLDFKSLNHVTGETGIEVWNGEWDSGTRDTKALGLWTHNRLLKGVKSYAFSGTDEHENVSTVNYQDVYMDSLSAGNLRTALKSGRHVASNNGWIDLSIGDKHMGDIVYVLEGDEIKKGGLL
ncbi:MAG: hypothetical protein AABX04_01245 [Nanoarchaeota archaeon]